jgi:YHYH protein
MKINLPVSLRRLRPFLGCSKILTAALLTSSSSFAVASPAAAASFEAFAPRVKLRWDENFLYIENNGLPAHGMMVGITNWQQQVPMPQAYTAENAWRLPLNPVPATQPQSIKGRFLRGAIAIAANGIPIFNPQNNRGEIAQEIGELDKWGGHCGRGDDYHYHAAPLHLQSVVGDGKPIAYALDGYPIYGLTEPGGATPTTLDAYNGHTTAALGYHYHSSKSYPYVNGGFHGEVTEREGQVDPQPRAQSVRPDQAPLAGAKITSFKAAANEKSFTLLYKVRGKTGSVKYVNTGKGVWKFVYVSSKGIVRKQTYSLKTLIDRPQNGPPQDGPPQNGPPQNGPPQDQGGPPPPPPEPSDDYQPDDSFPPLPDR